MFDTDISELRLKEKRGKIIQVAYHLNCLVNDPDSGVSKRCAELKGEIDVSTEQLVYAVLDDRDRNCEKLETYENECRHLNSDRKRFDEIKEFLNQVSAFIDTGLDGTGEQTEKEKKADEILKRLNEYSEKAKLLQFNGPEPTFVPNNDEHIGVLYVNGLDDGHQEGKRVLACPM